MELTERKKQILRAVVELYIDTAEPVGSKALIEFSGLKVSSATIRNEMSDLVDMGYLEQPHTSAGRVPSAKGYRLYVNELMQQHKLSMQETEQLNEALHMKMEELDRVIDQAGKMISQMTHYPAFALATGYKKVTIKRYNLLPVEDSSFIAVVMTDSNVVRNKLVRFPSAMDDKRIQLLNTLLNSTFTGLTKEEFTPDLMELARHAAGEFYGLVSLVISFAIEVLDELGTATVHTAGVTSLLQHPEYQSLDRAQNLMSYLSESDDTSKFPKPTDDGPMRILIGPENVAEELKDTSVVVASYDIGDNMRGIVGVVGPTRMDYAKVTARLSYFAEGLSKMFGKDATPVLPDESTNKNEE